MMSMVTFPLLYYAEQIESMIDEMIDEICHILNCGYEIK